MVVSAARVLVSLFDPGPFAVLVTLDLADQRRDDLKRGTRRSGTSRNFLKIFPAGLIDPGSERWVIFQKTNKSLSIFYRQGFPPVVVLH